MDIIFRSLAILSQPDRPEPLNMCVSLVTSVVSDALQPCGLWPTRLLCPWDPPDKNTGVGCRVIIQGNLPNPGAEPGSLADGFFTAEPTGKLPATQYSFIKRTTHKFVAFPLASYDL